MPFATLIEFKQFLDGASVALTGKRASTHKVRRHEPRTEAADLNWWRSSGRSDGLSIESRHRDRAYLITYFEAAGPELPAVGLLLADGSYVWPDRSVIERSLRDGHITFNTHRCSFVLTEAGARLLNPV